jgi:hypothetical protein
MWKQTIRKDLLEGGNGESHGGLQEGGIEDGTTRQICSRGKELSNVNESNLVTRKSTISFEESGTK